MACGIAMCQAKAAHATDANEALSCQAKNYAVQGATGSQTPSWPQQAPVHALDKAAGSAQCSSPKAQPQSPYSWTYAPAQQSTRPHLRGFADGALRGCQ